MKHLCLLILLCFSLVVSAEDKRFTAPDYKLIEKNVQDKSSSYYYPKLVGRFQLNDTMLNADEFTHLYFGGFFYKDTTSPFKAALSPERDSIKSILSKELLVTADYKELDRLVRLELLSSPLNLQNLNMLYNVATKLEDKQTVAYTAFKLTGLIGAIMATGDGLTDETALHVHEIHDEYFILGVLGYEFGGSQSLTPTQCDYLTVRDNSENIKGLYFDVKQIFKGYSSMFGGVDLEKMLNEVDKQGGKKKKRR